VLASAYQFTQADAKTADHFFKGFPSYWNVAVFYLYIGHLSLWANFAIIIFLAVMIFVPMKYLYLTRLDNVTRNPVLRYGLIIATLAYAACSAMLLAIYPESNSALVAISWAYGFLYIALSLYRTFVPLSME
jgi:phosphatidylcholine synthase